MVYISKEMTDAIREKHPIEEVVQRYVNLTLKGDNNYWGKCPFHWEKLGKEDEHDSMSVSPKRKMFQCFSCKTSGDVFKFIAEREKISYYEAVLRLAKEDGYEVGNYTAREEPFAKDYEVMGLAVSYYQNNLNGDLGTNAVAYLEQRLFDQKTIEKFEIGVSISRQPLTPYLIEAKQYDFSQLVDLGLTNADGTDFFQDRIMIPIHDARGKAIGFGGRIYQTKSGSKYINPKETKLFHKSDVLYNYHRACEVVKKDKTLILMEGYFDVIRASTAGIDNCVAPMGTSLTKEQIQLIKRVAERVILCFDGDEPGRLATEKAIELFEGIDIKVQVVRLEEKDPDEFIIKRGKEAFLQKLKYPMSVISFQKQILTEKYDLNRKEDIGDYVQEVLKLLVTNKNDSYIELEIKELAKRFDLEYEKLNRQFLEIKTKYETEKGQSQKVIEVEKKVFDNLEVKNSEKVEDMYGQATNNLLYYMTISPDVIEWAEPKVSKIVDDKKRRLFNEIIYYYHQYGTIVLADFVTYLSLKTNVADTFLEIMRLDLKKEYTITEIDDYIKCVNEYYKKNRIDKLRFDMKNETDPMKQASILMEIMKIRGVRTSD